MTSAATTRVHHRPPDLVVVSTAARSDTKLSTRIQSGACHQERSRPPPDTKRELATDTKRSRGLNLEFFYDNVGSHVKPARDSNRIRAFLQTYKKIENADTHF
ncbi:hypothetical protein ZWY2020_029689 [Hordeum vulgare]|nr:hypothetical protein ZWY2020_029689 [Hordeum vulgare]